MKKTPCPHCLGKGYIINQSTFGGELREKRIAAGISLRAMAERLDISAAYLSDLERGNRKWAPEFLKGYEKL